MTQETALIIPPESASLPVPAPIAELGERAAQAFVEFFVAQYPNDNTRNAYMRNAGDFLAWLTSKDLKLPDMQAFHAAAYVESLKQKKTRTGKPYKAATIKQHLASLNMLASFLVVRQIIPANPFTDVRAPKNVVVEGKTPVMASEDARKLFDSIDGTSAADVRDRAFIGVMLYTFARVSAAIACDVPDFYQVGRTMMLELQEKGGRTKAMPLNHSAVEYLDAYLAQLGEDSGPLFRALNPSKKGYTDRRWNRKKAWAMVKRRCEAAELGDRFCNHTFRGTGITTYLKNGGQLEHAQYMANHASATTTKLYDRRQQEVTLDEVERIVI